MMFFQGPVKLDEDWHDLIDTVGSFGTPEVADQISGAYYMTGTCIFENAIKSSAI